MASGLAERRLPKPPKAMPGLKARSALGHCAGRMPQVAERRSDPGVPVDDNGLGRRHKAFAAGRRNRQICDTPAGAEVSACMYSLVETAGSNGLEPRAWLERVLTEMPRLGEPQALSDADVERFLPWSEGVPEGCRQLKKPRL